MSANGNANEHTSYDSFYHEFYDEFVSKQALLPGGINLNRFSTGTGGLRKYPKFLFEAVRRRKVVPSLINGGFVKLTDIGIPLSVERRVDYGANAIIDTSLGVAGDKEPFFLYTNFMEAHMPHQPVAAYDDELYDAPASWTSDEVDNWEVIKEGPRQHSEYLERVRNLYRASIDYLDRRISEFITAMREETDRETTFIVTSDHGEMLGFEREGGALAHNIGGVAEPLIHVPYLVINPPGDVETDGLVSLCDVGQMCSDFATGENSDITSDRVAAERIGLPSWEEKVIEHNERWTRAQRCLYEGDSKFVWDSGGDFIKYRVGESPSYEERVSEHSYPSESDYETFFEEPIEDYKSRVSEGSANWEGDINEVDRQRLRDRGYI